MSQAWRWVRSAIYVGQVYVMMGVIGIVFFPFALISRDAARAATTRALLRRGVSPAPAARWRRLAAARG